MMHFYCSRCEKDYPIEGLDYQCECGGLFQLYKEEDEKITATVSLGEVKTPIIKRILQGREIYLKLDYMQPTGSFKDRGAFAVINKLKELGINEIVEDSSGNAGAAFAGYCAAAGIKCNIYLPESTSPGKIKQINAYKANVVKVPGTRDDTAKAILKAAKTTYYASHVYNPLFFEGTKSLAFEIYEQIGIPDYIVVPAGNGTMLLGIYKGFKEMGRLPRIIVVQSRNCAPVFSKFKNQSVGEMKPTAAEGIAIQEPKRIDEMIEAVTDSKGDIIVVDDVEVIKAQEMLGEMGIYIEVTSGAAVAGMLQYFKDGYDNKLNIVVPLTGMGLKK
ncbi:MULTISPECIES: pyridoxal-phosphate dependent enzyme [Pelosinus]|uniref:Threonine synthase n=2 Tax=Pelosinus TaxID=365348 RepID=I9NSB8_9FIRM|nr:MULTISPECIES: pyridoxal-phosphate dependent enzyme [Pelosinus]AJQ29338.1 Threonine synthase [Pelosinus fermentans JBW45]MCC5466816.1 pyridoxal-phosphate dependent enzyme [Pelosinus baikalensis]